MELPSSFTEGDDIEKFLASAQSVKEDEVVARLPKDPPREGPSLTVEQAYIWRAAAVDACEMMIEALQAVSTETPELQWMKKVTTTDLDIWLWAVAKDRPDYRKLERFVLRNTVMF